MGSILPHFFWFVFRMFLDMLTLFFHMMFVISWYRKILAFVYITLNFDSFMEMLHLMTLILSTQWHGSCSTSSNLPLCTSGAFYSSLHVDLAYFLLTLLLIFYLFFALIRVFFSLPYFMLLLFVIIFSVVWVFIYTIIYSTYNTSVFSLLIFKNPFKLFLL